MKKYFELCGFLMLLFFSFYYTNKTMTVVRNTDDIMVNIKSFKDENNILAIDAVIEGDYIYPGISGTEVDISKSYDAMKKVGSYVPSLIKYKKIKPKISISNIYNKYITKGNSKKNMVSLIFKGDIDSILPVISKYNIDVNFFTNKEYISDNIIITEDIFKKNQKYCYLENLDDGILNICSMNKMHTIIPTFIANDFHDIKKNLSSGSIISLDVNDKLVKEFDYIINYINKKGFDIVNLDNLLEE